jgi:hypothetical protein
MIWVLILFAHAGPMSDKDSMAMTNVPGFTTQSACQSAGEQAKKMASLTTKVVKYTCVELGK